MASSQKAESRFPCCRATTAQHRTWQPMGVLWTVKEKPSWGFCGQRRHPASWAPRKWGDPLDFPLVQPPGTFLSYLGRQPHLR